MLTPTGSASLSSVFVLFKFSLASNIPRCLKNLRCMVHFKVPNIIQNTEDMEQQMSLSKSIAERCYESVSFIRSLANY